MEYDSIKKEYYITTDDVLKETLINTDELTRIFGNDVNKSLKILSHSIYRLMYSYYRGVYTQDHITYIQTKIADNVNNEQTYLLNAMIEYVIGAVQSGVDLRTYVEDLKSVYPETVMQELRNGMLLDKSRKIIET